MKLNWATKNRRKEREANLKMLNDLERSNGDTRRINELKKSLITPSAVQVDEVRQLVTAFGLPHVNAPYEAEAQCAELVLQNIAHAVVTEDSDVLPLGVSLIRKLNTTEQFDLKAALSKMEINQREFIDFCLLSGTDYLPTLKNMGPVRALRAIKDHKTIEKILSVKDASVVPSPFEEARKMFTEPMVTPANEISVSLLFCRFFFFLLLIFVLFQIQWAKMDIEKVIEFLCRGQRTFDEPGFRQKLTGLQSDIDKRTKSSAKRASDSHEDASESKKKVKCSPDEIPVPYITPDWKTGEGYDTIGYSRF